MSIRHTNLRVWLGAAVVFALAGLTTTAAAQEGGQLFQTTCGPCHTIGGGTRVGPDLEGVSERRSEDWIISFVQDSQAMIRSGDADAQAVAQQFNNLVMPPQALSDDQVRSVIAYIDGGGGGGTELGPISAEDIALGALLFNGRARFENGGPACNSCHHVKNDAVIGGGVLAKDLTTVFSRMGGPGVGAIVGSPPFPVMQLAYEDRALTEDEVRAVVGFLQDADAQQAFQTPKDYGVLLVLYGGGVFLVLMALFGILWRRRKGRSVNQKIYDRQVRSI